MDESQNTLLFGDNLLMLERVADESVDLIYIDPPFNSARQYNLLFKQVKGDPSPAQIMAFEDTWRWSPALMEQFMESCDHPRLRRFVDSLYDILGDSEMMAYVVAMAPRLEALHRKLKASGSFYLHCDPAASHYLKLLLDLIFGGRNFRNEIIWKRTNVHNDSKTWSRVNDVILFYTWGDTFTWNPQYAAHSEAHISSKYAKRDENGRAYTLDNMTSPNPRPNMMYEWKGFAYPPNGWRYSQETMAKLDSEGRVWYPTNSDGSHDTTKRPRLKRYLDEMQGTIHGTNWTDIRPINSQAKERRGYPTQKPVSLLERIMRASSNQGDLILDAFCGCGTTIAAAQRLGRRWVGIDVTYLAIREIEDRLMEDFGLEKGVDYRVEGLPADVDAARHFFEITRKDSHKQFEMWAVGLVGGRPREKKGGDKGIDGDLLLHSPDRHAVIVPVQVKGGALNPSMIRDFAHVINREKAPIGALLTLERPTRGMEQEALTIGSIECQGRPVPRLQLLPIGDVLERNVGIRVPDGYSMPPSRYRAQGQLRL